MFSLMQHFGIEVYSFGGLCTIICLILIYNVTKKFYDFRYMREHGLPMVYGLPFLGIFHQCVPVSKILYVLGSYFEKVHSWSFLTWFGNVPFIVTADPVIIKTILNSDVYLSKCGVIYDTLSASIPNGIITSKYFKWRHNRKVMNQSYSPQIVQQFMPNFINCSKRISKYFGSLRAGEEHEIFDRIKQEFLEMTAGTIIGTVVEEGETINGNVAKHFNELFGKIVTDATLSFLNLSFLIRNSRYYEIKNNLKCFMENLIARKLDSNIKNDDKYFLDRAIKYQQQNLFNIDDVVIETHSLIIASFETTSTALYSVIVMLAMHQDVQQKLYQEIIQVLADSEDIDYTHLNQCPYLNMVIDETLRLIPSVTLIGREPLESCHLTDDIKLPRDFQIIISIFHLHRRKDLWGENAEQFNPDNFLPENMEKRHPYSYIPFSKGLRNCIGWRYALIALKVLVLNLVRDSKFSTDFPYSDLRFVNQLGLRFLKEPKIQFVKRYVGGAMEK